MKFWTCGFFPGLLYSLVERAVKYPHVFPFLGHAQNVMGRPDNSTLLKTLLSLCRTWTQPLHGMVSRLDTHDLGFMFMPALKADWELTGNTHSLQLLLTAARSLSSRYNPKAKAIRSWDSLCQKNVNITSLSDDFLVIIDSMCNLDLLFYASFHLSDPKLAEIATCHATSLLATHLRPEAARPPGVSPYTGVMYSTYHVVNVNPTNGRVKDRRTAQGYSETSTWARGQAWAILGYTQTFMWTKKSEFLSAACGLSEYFLWRLETSPPCVETPSRGIGRYVPMWDFDAPIEDTSRSPLRDSSAGVIAANGMLLLSQALESVQNEALARRFRLAAMAIVKDTLQYSLSSERARLSAATAEEEPDNIQIADISPGQRFDALLKHATANHNIRDYARYSDHGLIYADYYLLEFGNKLLRLGLV